MSRPRATIVLTAENPITTGVFDGFSWIRCEGKGSFINSPVVKSFGDKRIAEGEMCLVVDLAACSGMDSTFMGTLGGLARRLMLHEGTLQIAEPGARNQRSLEDLGLDNLMDIQPESAIWKEHLPEIRSRLTNPASKPSITSLQRAHHVLEAHRRLSEVNDKNARIFSGVIDTLRRDIDQRSDPGAKSE